MLLVFPRRTIFVSYFEKEIQINTWFNMDAFKTLTLTAIEPVFNSNIKKRSKFQVQASKMFFTMTVWIFCRKCRLIESILLSKFLVYFLWKTYLYVKQDRNQCTRNPVILATLLIYNTAKQTSETSYVLLLPSPKLSSDCRCKFLPYFCHAFHR